MFTEFGIQIGPILIYWYAIIIMSGALIAFILALREAKKHGADADAMMDLFLWLMFFGYIGARAYYVIFTWEVFSDNIWDIFNVRMGGIAIYGGVIGGAIAAYAYSKIKKINYLLILDIIAPLLLLAQGIGRWGNFINQEAYGAIVPGTTLVEQTAYLKQFFIPDFIVERMLINGAYHQPTFLYESVWNILGFILIYVVIRNWKKLRLGILTCSYLIWYGIGRFVIEGMRTDSLYITESVRVSQALSAVLVIAGIAGILYIMFNKARIYYQNTKFYNNA